MLPVPGVCKLVSKTFIVPKAGLIFSGNLGIHNYHDSASRTEQIISVVLI